MSETMLALGNFRFSLDTAAYSELKRNCAYRWSSVERLDARPARQFIGLGEETINLTGMILPHYKGGLNQIEKLKALAGNGEPLIMVDGKGIAWGNWVALSIEETQTFFTANGLPRKITFTINLGRYGDDSL
ncbi:phage tail protein [Agarilytica rhodophyticola]|uniref:phage tail protein n=1 Tax=Agarilytica rhodophyticola TaxID=1737490 RepID=UPI000B3474F6|nr:phage tail protein [Agarilytica rhodophyticola]